MAYHYFRFTKNIFRTFRIESFTFRNNQVNNFDGHEWEILKVDYSKSADVGETVYSLQTVFRNDSSFGLLTEEMMGSPIRHLNDSMISLGYRDTYLYDFK